MSFATSKKDPREEMGTEIVEDKVKLTDIPKFSDLNQEVMTFVRQCTWMDKYGIDWCITIMGFIMVYVALICMQSPNVLTFCLGVFIYGYCFQMFAVHTPACTMLCASPAR